MKKNIILTSLLILTTVAVNAQLDEFDSRERFQIGIKAGASFSNVYDSKIEDFKADPKVGFTGGVFFAIPLGKFVGLQPEVMITQKGFQGTGKLLGSNYNFNRTTTFLEIPLMLAIKPSPFLTIVVGPQYSFLLHQRDQFTNSEVNVEQEQEFKQDNIRKNIFGFVGGIDINIKRFVIGGRISFDAINNRGDGTSNTPRYKNVCGQITLGFKFL